jgi:PAS domain S-box-containing protein
VTVTASVNVLVVDDNFSKRVALRSILLPLGYTIVEATSGEAALRCVLQQDFAVILLDVRMPGMDGFETAALIRLRRQSEMTPIIFITAYAMKNISTAKRFTQGAVDFIFGPIRPDELRAKVTVFANLFVRAQMLAAQARELKVSADQLRQLTDAAPIGIFQTDSHHRYVYTNPHWTELTGVQADAAFGQSWEFILSPKDQAALAATWADGSAPPSEFTQRFEIGGGGPDPRVVIVTVKSIPATDGATSGWVGTLGDVTAEARAEVALSRARDEATEATELKSNFLANMSHEIRTPMNGVLGMTDLLLETDLDARQRDYAQTVRNSGEALLIIINDILDFSRIEAGKLEVEAVEVDLRRIVDEVADLLGGSAQRRGLGLFPIVDDDVPLRVIGDPGRVRQVLTNLIGNAIKFTTVGAIGIRVQVDEVADAAMTVRFEVTDTGNGIAPEQLSSIFQPFVQADTSTSRKYGGTGLGLAISSQLVALMGGSCGVSSELGVGSNFWFTVKVAIDDGPQVPPQAFAASGVEAPTADPVMAQPLRRPVEPPTGRLLLAEDNLINQKVAVAMLAGVGYQVDTVLNGAEAVKAAAARRYDAILMDCQMPELNGYEATAAIRGREAGGRRTPIIALTAGARQEDQDRCLAEGMDSYLSKPVNKDALLAIVAAALKGSPVIARTPPAATSPEATRTRERLGG